MVFLAFDFFKICDLNWLILKWIANIRAACPVGHTAWWPNSKHPQTGIVYSLRLRNRCI